MPSQKFARAPLWCALSLALGLAVTTPQAEAAGLGRLAVTSGLGQPLRAELEVTSIGRDELPTLQVRMAPIAAFRAANLDFNPALTNLRFALDKRADGGYFVRISSAQPVNEPYLDLMVELTWATGRVIREYTVLLDPPSLRADAPILPPVAATASPVAPAVVPPTSASRQPATPSTAPGAAPPPSASASAPPAATTTPTAAPRPAPSASAPSTGLATTPSEGSYVVKSGDTLGAIAARNKPSSVSLDQMLVAMLRANPDAFVAKNINRLRAGSTLTIPSESEAAALEQREARREVVAQSADFAQYRSRLAQAAGSAPVVATAPAAAGSGRVTARVQDQSAPASTGGDQLKIARADTKSGATSAAAAAAAKADEAAAKARAVREEQERAAQLKKTNDAIQKALQVQSKAGAVAQKQAEKSAPAPVPATSVAPAPTAVSPPAPMPVPAPTPAPSATTPSPAPVTAVSPSGTPPVTPTPIDSSKSSPSALTPPSTSTATSGVSPPPAPPVTPVATTPPPVKKAAPLPPPPREEPGFFSELFSNTLTVIGLVGVIVLLILLFAWSAYRKRRAESSDRFKETGEGVQANSMFGATGGQSVDTGTSTFNSSFIPAASQLDSNEVDPVAEADVYIAYGREEQAEDILKEAIRLQPDRHAVRVKLMEIYARRGDRSSFMAMAEELRDRTGAAGEDWERGVKLGRTVDPSHAMFAGAVGASLGDTTRGPTTGFRIDSNTRSGRPATLGGGATGGLDLGGLTGSSVMSRDTTSANVPPLTKMVVDTRSTNTTMQVETKMPQDTKMSGPATTSAPTTQFRATLPGEDAAEQARSAAAAMGASTDFGSLDFDLGPTRMGSLDVATRMPDFEESPSPAPSSDARRGGDDMDVFAATAPQRAEPPAVADIDNAFSKDRYPAMAPTATGVGAIPDLDLNIPPTPSRMPGGQPTRMPIAPAPMMEEALSRPTVIGVKSAQVGNLPDEQAARLTANTDQATVPLIDFDLSAVSLDAATKRGETEPGSALAQQMATKLDLARGYIDLGVKDGARELLDEVMRDGTREQRQNAVDLIKQIES